MQQQIGFAHLVECRFERFDQLRRQFANESYGIRQQEGQVVEDHLAHRRVERGEEFVLGENLALGDEVHQRRFAHVGISHQRHAHQLSAVGALHGHLAVDLFEILLQFRDAVAYDTAVGFDLAFAGAAARTRASALPFEVRPQAGEPGQHVFVLGQLHLRFGIGRLRTREEDVQNQARAVEDAAGHRPLDVAGLRRREFVVEDRHVDGVFFAVGGDLFEFARSHVDARRGLRQPLAEPSDRRDVGRFGQKFQLVEVLLALAEFLAVAHDGHQYGSFAFRYSCGGLYGGFVLCHNSSRIEKKGIPRKEIPLLLIRTSEGRTVRGTVSGGR